MARGAAAEEGGTRRPGNRRGTGTDMCVGGGGGLFCCAVLCCVVLCCAALCNAQIICLCRLASTFGYCTQSFESATGLDGGGGGRCCHFFSILSAPLTACARIFVWGKWGNGGESVWVGEAPCFVFFPCSFFRLATPAVANQRAREGCVRGGHPHTTHGTRAEPSPGHVI